MLLIFSIVWPWFLCGTVVFLSVRSLLIAKMTWYSGFCLLCLSSDLHVTLANLRKFGFEFHLRSSWSSFSAWSVYYGMITYAVHELWIVIGWVHMTETFRLVCVPFSIRYVTVVYLKCPENYSPCSDASRSFYHGQPADYFIACYTTLTRPNKVKTAIDGCNSWPSLWILSRRCPVKLST